MPNSRVNQVTILYLSLRKIAVTIQLFLSLDIFVSVSVLPSNFIGGWDHFSCRSFPSYQLLVGASGAPEHKIDTDRYS